AFQYLARLGERGVKPNWEAHAAARFDKTHSVIQAALKKRGISANVGYISCAFPPGGIQDNTVNRLLLMSSSERHLPNVPMAFFIGTKSVTGVNPATSIRSLRAGRPVLALSST